MSSLAPSIGQTLGHYRILEQIGAGGMGVVYQAYDTKLERNVALKVLPSGALADEPARKRFRREALVLAKLNHPNIETVHEFGNEGGIDFLVTEYIPGVTLDAKLSAGPLPEKQVVELGIQLAEGIAAAHHKGLVHRDLKPANLRVTSDGHLKLLDFGLASLALPEVELARTATLTASQEITGTLPYMAPEQLRGEKADLRSDIWSTGGVLYEMATGKRPFEAKVSTALVNDIINKPAIPPVQLNPKFSPKLEDIILKCLEKDPAHRYQSAKELAIDLRRLTMSSTMPAVVKSSKFPALSRHAIAGAGFLVMAALLMAAFYAARSARTMGPASAARVMLAVLPFDNLSGDSDQEYFSDGLTEEMITQLGYLNPERVGVIARVSAMQYKRPRKTVTRVGKELGVD